MGRARQNERRRVAEQASSGRSYSPTSCGSFLLIYYLGNGLRRCHLIFPCCRHGPSWNELRTEHTHIPGTRAADVMVCSARHGESKETAGEAAVSGQSPLSIDTTTRAFCRQRSACSQGKMSFALRKQLPRITSVCYTMHDQGAPSGLDPNRHSDTK